MGSTSGPSVPNPPHPADGYELSNSAAVPHFDNKCNTAASTTVDGYELSTLASVPHTDIKCNNLAASSHVDNKCNIATSTTSNGVGDAMIGSESLCRSSSKNKLWLP